MAIEIQSLPFEYSTEHPRAPEYADLLLADAKAEHAAASDALYMVQRHRRDPSEIDAALDRVSAATDALRRVETFKHVASSPAARKAQQEWLRSLEREAAEHEKAIAAAQAMREKLAAEARTLFIQAFERCRDGGQLASSISSSSLAFAIRDHFAKLEIPLSSARQWFVELQFTSTRHS